MAKEFSFDCVSQVDIQEADNAYQQAKKELSQRYDLKDSGSTIDFEKAAGKVTIIAPSDFVLGQVRDIFTSKLVKRNIDLKACNFSKPLASSGGNVTSVGTFVNGLDKEKATQINKDINSKLKLKLREISFAYRLPLKTHFKTLSFFSKTKTTMCLCSL